MSMHTYVGARYVPRFMGTYDPTQQYEALDVVDNGSGTSYIARKIVPAGTPLTDTDHWFVYGASSGAIIQLQNDMIQAQNDITGLQGDVATLDRKFERNLLVIGNSYVSYGCADKLKSVFNNAYQRVRGGVGFIPYTGETDDLEDVLDDAIADASIPKTKITDVIVISAMGDTRACNEATTYSQYKTDLETAISSFMTKVKSNFTNAKFIGLSFAETRDQAYFSNNKYDNLWKVHKAFKELAPKHDMHYYGWSGFNTLMNSTYLQADHYHPSTAGAEMIGQFILDAYFGHVEYNSIQSNLSSTFVVKYTADTTTTALVRFTPDEVQFSIRRWSFTPSAALTLGANDDFIKFNQLPIPIPAPIQADTLFTILVDRTGQYYDFLILDILPDTHGIAELKTQFAPRQTTAPTNNYMYAPQYNNFKYII